MEDRGEVVRYRRNRYGRPDRSETFTGALSIHPRGFGFVTDEAAPDREAYVPAEALAGALHDDRVRVAVVAAPPREPRRRRRDAAPALRWRGRVLEVLERPARPVVGLLHEGPGGPAVIPDDPRFPQNVRIDGPGGALRELPPAGRKVTVALAPWAPHHRVPRGRVIEDLGDPADPAVAMTGLLRRHGIAETFPGAAERQARAVRPPAPDAAETAGRRDLRGLAAFTVDPEDAKDYDDAVSLEPDADGGWRLGVHIADVAHFVPPDSAIDREARERGTSTYLVDRTVTMLPGHLTAEVCSLRPEQDRFTRSVLLRLAPDGTVCSAETFPSRIRSRARLSYRQVQAFFDGADPGGIPAEAADALRAMRGLARALRARRMRAGALDLQTPEIRCQLDAGGRVTAIERRTETEAYGLIEEFMLAANRAVAQRLGAAGSPCLYRIHDAPDAAQWEEMARDLGELGFELATRSREALNRLVRQAAGTPLAYPVTLAILRNLKRALYAPHHRPHFGLAFDDYTHFTSPIRRYPDLVTHRLLDAVERGASPPLRNEALKELGLHCSRREREADEAERESVELKRLDYYAARLADGDTGPWPATVVSAIPRGVLVELPDTLQRGLVPFATLPGGRARRDGPGRTPGDRIEVRLARVDLARRQVDFRPAVSGSGRSASASRRRAPRPARRPRDRRG